MKSRKIFAAAGVSLVLGVMTGCATCVTPDPLPGVPASISDTVPLSGKPGVFLSAAVPVAVQVKGDASAVAFLKKRVPGKYAAVTTGKTSGDIVISVRSKVRVVTPAPQCRLMADVTVSSNIVPEWKSTAESGSACTRRNKAAKQLRKAVARGLAVYADDILLKELKNNYGCTVLRFHSVKPGKLQELTKLLTQIKGVKKVAVIEFNKQKRIASFRILYNKNIVRSDLKDAYIEKQKELER